MDNEVSGSGNQYDYGFRIYNPRLGRFLSTDPLSSKYPWYTPYQFAGNKPIVAVDIDGLEEWMANQHSALKSKVAFQIQSAKNGQSFIGPATPSKPPVSVQIHRWATGETKSTNAEKLLSTNPLFSGVTGIKILYNLVNDTKILFTRDKDGEQTDLIGQRASATKKDEAFFNVTTTAFGIVAGGVTKLIQFPSAESQVLLYAEDVLNSTPKSKVPRSVTSIVDKETGQIFNGQSGGLKEQEINPQLKKLFPDKSLEKWAVDNCSECDALNKALNAGVKPQNLEMHTLKIEKATGTTTSFPRCANCQVTTQQIKTTSD